MHGGSFFRILLRTVLVLSWLTYAATLSTRLERVEEGTEPRILRFGREVLDLSRSGERDEGLQASAEMQRPLPDAGIEILEQSPDCKLATSDDCATEAASQDEPTSRTVVSLPELKERHESHVTIGPDDGDYNSYGDAVDVTEEAGQAAPDELPEGLTTEISAASEEEQRPQTTEACCPVQEPGCRSTLLAATEVEADGQPTLFQRVPRDLQLPILGYAQSLESYFLMQRIFGLPSEDLQLSPDNVLEILKQNPDDKLVDWLMYLYVGDRMVKVEKVEQEMRSALLVTLLRELLEELLVVLDGEEHERTLWKCCRAFFRDGRLDYALWTEYFGVLTYGVHHGAIPREFASKRLAVMLIGADWAGSERIVKETVEEIDQWNVDVDLETYNNFVAQSDLELQACDGQAP